MAPLDQDTPFALLLIEDSTSDSELVLALLEECLPHARVDVAANLHDALDRLAGKTYDATLADLSLPDAEGLAVVQAVRARFPDTALLVLTGRSDGQLALWALAEGAQDYLVKGQHDGPRLATALLHALQRARAEQESHNHLELSRGLLDAMEAPTCAVDADSRIVVLNQAWRDSMTSRRGDPRSSGVGAHYLAACDQVVERGGDDSDAVDAARVAAGLRAVLARSVPRFQHDYPCHAPDTQSWFSVRITPAVVGGSPGAVISHVDITELRLMHDVLSHRSLHDVLTGLPNRLLLDDRLQQALADAQRGDASLALAFLDLDRFKEVNDTLGHTAGDLLLVQVARRLEDQLRTGDTLCRWSGDEFVVIWKDVDSEAQALALSQRLLTALSDPALVGGRPVALSCSVGVVLSDGSRSSEQLLMAADTAMYDAKGRGGGRVSVHTGVMHETVQERFATEASLRLALEREELVLHYQPVLSLDTGRVVGVEALCRWQHPTRGLVDPDQFVPVAEASGLVVPLGSWALTQACADAVSLTAALGQLRVAVNVSARQLVEPDFVPQVRRALAASGLDPQRLVLEVTESSLMRDEALSALVLEEVAGLGVGIAIDDFGTGYSSLLYLRRFPISSLKLDKAFVSGIGVSLDDESICRSVVGLADAVRVDSVGEGVETAAQYAALRAYGCTQGQGWLWSPAVPLAALPEAVERCHAVPVPLATADRRRPVMSQDLQAVRRRVSELQDAGASLLTVAAALNQAGTLTAAGLRWTAPAVARLLVS